MKKLLSNSKLLKIILFILLILLFGIIVYLLCNFLFNGDNDVTNGVKISITDTEINLEYGETHQIIPVIDSNGIYFCSSKLKESFCDCNTSNKRTSLDIEVTDSIVVNVN